MIGAALPVAKILPGPTEEREVDLARVQEEAVVRGGAAGVKGGVAHRIWCLVELGCLAGELGRAHQIDDHEQLPQRESRRWRTAAGDHDCAVRR